MPQRELEATTVNEREEAFFVGKKTRDSHTPELADRQQQAPGPQKVRVVGAGLGLQIRTRRLEGLGTGWTQMLSTKLQGGQSN